MAELRRLSEIPGATPIRLAQLAVEGNLVICAGAGLSRDAPTELPTGTELARRMHSLLVGRIPGLAECDAIDLVCLGDTLEAETDGMSMLQHLLLETYKFTQATPNLAHQACGFLVAEGAVSLLTTNWDDCVERAQPVGERLQAVVSDEDRRDIHGALVLKIHGCATRPASMLISTAQLAQPPVWATTELQSRLHDATVAFIGMADVPPHARRRVEQLVEEMNAGGIRVVNKIRPEAWDGLLPGASDDQFILQSALEFLDDLARAYVELAFIGLETVVAGHRELGTYDGLGLDEVAGTNAFVATAREFNALEFLCLVRRSAYQWACGETVLHSNEMRSTMLALALICAVLPARRANGRIAIGDMYVELLLAHGEQTGRLVGEGESTVAGTATASRTTARGGSHCVVLWTSRTAAKALTRWGYC